MYSSALFSSSALKNLSIPLITTRLSHLTSLAEAEKTHTSVKELMTQLVAFTPNKDNLLAKARAGFTNKEFEALKVLIEERKALKEARLQDKPDLNLYKQIMANALKLKPYEQKMTWWEQAPLNFDDDTWWEKLAKACSNQNSAEPSANLVNRLAQLKDIQEEWQHISAYAAVSSENLLNFFENHVLALEIKINEVLNIGELDEMIIVYLRSAASKLQDIKEQLIHSMAIRLCSAEFYEDLKCDDLINYICHRIEKVTNIKLFKNGKIPNMRRGLKSPFILEFVNHIREYIQHHPEDNFTSIHFHELTMSQLPTSPIIVTHAHPLVLYFLHHFSRFFIEITQKENVIKGILVHNKLEDNTWLLNRTAYLVKHTQKWMRDVETSSRDNTLLLILDQYLKQFSTFIDHMTENLLSILDKELIKLFDIIFKNRELDKEEMEEILNKVKNVTQYIQKFSPQAGMTPVTDLLLHTIRESQHFNFHNFDHRHLYHLMEIIEKNISLEIEQVQSPFSFKQDFEGALFIKLNNPYLIIEYVFDKKNGEIDLINLSDLLYRLSQFFSHKEYSEKIATTIKQVCQQMARDHVIRALQQKTEFNMPYLQSLSHIIGEDCLAPLRGDKEIKLLFKKYSKTYLGEHNQLGPLFLELTPTCTRVYAKKRLRYMAQHKQACVNDYAFFKYACEDKRVFKLFKKNKKRMAQYIPALLKKPSGNWNEADACLIELYAEPEYVMIYRIQRLREFAFKLYNTPEAEANPLFEQFLASANPHRQIPLIHSHSLLRSTIEYVVAHCQGEILLIRLIETYGDLENKQQCHFNLFMFYLEHYFNFNETWLARMLKKMNDDESFNAFFGSTNIPILCDYITHLVQPLAQHSDDPVPLLKLMACLKPVQGFYLKFGKDEATKELFKNFSRLEQKFTLQLKYKEMSDHNESLIDMLQINPELYQIALVLIKAVKTLQETQNYSATEIQDYLSILNQDVFDKLKELLHAHETLPFYTLATIINLLFALTSDNLKYILLHAHQAELSDNPLWLQLINHLSDTQIILSIQRTMEKTPSNHIHFLHTLLFAKRLTMLKQHAIHLLKCSLLKETGIEISPQHSFSTLLALPTIKSTALIKLWINCMEKMNSMHLPVDTQARYLHLLIKLLISISQEILTRAANNPPLLGQFFTLFPMIPELKKTLSFLSSEPEQETSALSFWKDISLTDKIMRPLFIMTQHAFALQLKQKIEDYLVKKIMAVPLQQFQTFCLGNAWQDATSLKKVIATTFKIQNDLVLLKIMTFVRLYTALSTAPVQGKAEFIIPALLESIVKETEQHPIFKKSKTYLPLLLELQTLANKHFAAKNAEDFTWQPEKKGFSLGLGF